MQDNQTDKQTLRIIIYKTFKKVKKRHEDMKLLTSNLGFGHGKCNENLLSLRPFMLKIFMRQTNFLYYGIGCSKLSNGN